LDGTRIPQRIIRTEVSKRMVPLSKPGSSTVVRIARIGEALSGIEKEIDGVPWIVFADGLGVQKEKLFEAWDAMAIEAWIEEDGVRIRELFE
jgi:hypothetical protein